jgi:hypothetical protein
MHGYEIVIMVFCTVALTLTVQAFLNGRVSLDTGSLLRSAKRTLSGVRSGQKVSGARSGRKANPSPEHGKTGTWFLNYEVAVRLMSKYTFDWATYIAKWGSAKENAKFNIGKYAAEARTYTPGERQVYLRFFRDNDLWVYKHMHDYGYLMVERIPEDAVVYFAKKVYLYDRMRKAKADVRFGGTGASEPKVSKPSPEQGRHREIEQEKRRKIEQERFRRIEAEREKHRKEQRSGKQGGAHVSDRLRLFFEALEMEPTQNTSAIKAAYRRKMKKCHLNPNRQDESVNASIAYNFLKKYHKFK